MGDIWSSDKGVFLWKFNSGGIVQWKSVLGEKNDFATTVYETPDRGFLVAGSHDQYSYSGIWGFYLVKTDSLGQSGCNPEQGSSSSYNFPSSLCVINDVSVSYSNNQGYVDITLFSDTISRTVVDPCCYAKPEITTEEYSCSGDSIHYYGSGALHFQWYNGDTTDHIFTTDTMVSLTVSNTCGNFTDTMIVHPGFVPSFTYFINKDTICRGDSVLVNISGNAPYYALSDQYYGQYINKINDTVYVLKPTRTTIFTIRGYTGYYGPGCSSQQTFAIYVNPDKPTITKIADTLFSSFPINNQWLFNGNSISGATNPTLIITQAGSYSVEVTIFACSNLSDSFYFAPDSMVYTQNAWKKMIGSDGYGTGTCTRQAEDGGLIIGSNYSQGGYASATKEDIALIKTGRNGEVLWSKIYGGPLMDRINSLIRVNSGYVGVGSTNSFGKGNKDVYLLSFDENGQLLWSKTYGDWNDQEGYSVEQTSDGGFIITGYSTNPYLYTVVDGWGVDEDDLYLLKTDSNGTLLWSKIFDASGNERGVEAHETSDGNYIVAGSSEYRMYILKTDAEGNLIWGRGTDNAVYPGSMKIIPNGNFLICSGISNHGSLLKFDENGDLLWSKKIHDISYAKGMVITNDNAAVFTAGFGFGNESGFLTKIDLNGNLIWTVKQASSAQQYISDIEQLSDGSFLLIGCIDTANHYGPGQIFIVNTDMDGQTNCSQFFYPGLTDEPYTFYSATTSVSSLGAEMDAETNLYEGFFQISTICPSAPPASAVKETSGDFALKVYPNPFAGIINLEFSKFNGPLNIAIFEITGRCIYKQSINANASYQVELNKTRGFYFLEIISGEKREVRKIILQ